MGFTCFKKRIRLIQRAVVCVSISLTNQPGSWAPFVWVARCSVWAGGDPPALTCTGARKGHTLGGQRGEWDLGLKNLVDGAEKGDKAEASKGRNANRGWWAA